MQKINTSVKAIYINSHKETLGSGIHNIMYCFKCTIPDYFETEKMKLLLQEKIFSILFHHFQSAGCLDGIGVEVLILLFSFFFFFQNYFIFYSKSKAVKQSLGSNNFFDS